MNTKTNKFNKIYKQEIKIGILKAILSSIIISFSVISAFIIFLYFINFLKIVLVIIIPIIVFIISFILLYFLKFRPKILLTALSMEQNKSEARILTMIESKDDDSIMAKLQREDTEKFLLHLKPKKLINRQTLKLIYSAVPIFILGISLFTFSLLVSFKKVPSFKERFNPKTPKMYKVSYKENAGGKIIGEIFQLISEGGNASKIIAIPDNGYVFDRWSDNRLTPNRFDKDIREDITVTAIFKKIPEKSEIMKSDDVMDENFDIEAVVPLMPLDGGAAGKYEERNQVLDGKTYYRDVYFDFFKKEMMSLYKDGQLPKNIIAIIQEYFKVIR